jgi:hypothetical protein
MKCFGCEKEFKKGERIFKVFTYNGLLEGEASPELEVSHNVLIFHPSCFDEWRREKED